MRIYYIKDISIEEIVQKHVESHNRPPIKVDDDLKALLEKIFPVLSEDKIPKRKGRKVSNDILYHKYVYLLHMIISKCLGTQDYSIYLNASILKQILGAVYVDMLKILKELNIIELSDYYIVGKCSKKIWINKSLNYGYKEKPLNIIGKYKDKEDKALKIHIEKKSEEHTSQIGKFLYRNYTDSLRQLSLSYPEQAIYYSKNRIYQSYLAKLYYERIIEKYREEKFRITSIDQNKRIYSLLTSTPRELKHFLNIKYSIDISNSHPLLFNKHIMDQYGINLSIINQLLFINKNTLPIGNVGKFLRKKLIESNIYTDEVQHIPVDILEYIYKTSKGIFWDDFKNQFKYFSRQDVKVILFREVFYTKGLTNRNKPFGKLFNKHYPNVNKIIKKFIRNDKTRTKLPNSLMRFESEIFQNILTELYKKRFRVLSIHDAIVVLDVVQNVYCTPEIVSSMIEKVYKDYNLYPSISLDHYDSTFGCDIIQRNHDNMLLIENFKDNLIRRSNDPLDKEREMIQNMLLLVQQGSADFVVEKGEVVFHSLNGKFPEIF